ncbi:hypothetical protein BOX15_Mlig004036g1 [Macrostomum lignano]|uniref:protein acetyllysine N-acetyltransferase n=2 Tax=Macrostomum lignano TaxID=282301 RepID=A0A267FFS8_9PLAT|nr:hypothetical protein BOX15_Mlig004036g1 [Macrostomum lignano]
MAFSAHKDPEQLKEQSSTDEVLNAQADQLAELIRSAKHFVAFTGAGISTSAGIPDFRGPDGVWTRRAQGREAPRGVSTTSAMPTPTHMALVALANSGHLKLLISQNCDGLHRRSGFPPDRLAELHGNSNLELCSGCGLQYLRDFHVRTSGKVHEHQTGRACPVCSGALLDSVVNFGESLPEKPMRMGFEHCHAADLVLCLGSSLTVTPAANMPEEAAERGAKLVICNLQNTPLDSLSSLRIYGRTDELMTRVCSRLGIQLPAWQLRRRLRVDVHQPTGDEKGDKSALVATFGCVEADNTPATVFQKLSVHLVQDGNREAKEILLGDFDRRTCARSTEFQVRLPQSLPCKVTLAMTFMGHYGEPGLKLTLCLTQPCRYAKQPILMLFDPRLQRWSCEGV